MRPSLVTSGAAKKPGSFICAPVERECSVDVQSSFIMLVRCDLGAVQEGSIHPRFHHRTVSHRLFNIEQICLICAGYYPSLLELPWTNGRRPMLTSQEEHWGL